VYIFKFKEVDMNVFSGLNEFLEEGTSTKMFYPEFDVHA
jgi:hypothetical protein